MFLGINIFWALLRAHFNPRLTARAKMSLSRAQNIFNALEHKLCCFIIIKRLRISSASIFWSTETKPDLTEADMDSLVVDHLTETASLNSLV